MAGMGGSANLDVVQLDALVVLKIIKHCRESLPELVTGQLLGLDVGSTLEVTNCFPFPQAKKGTLDPDDDTEGADYQIDMMFQLREVNVDNNTVGWYQSTYLGSFLNEAIIDTQFNYQQNIEKSIVIVYDPLRTTQGTVSLKVYRLTQAFMNTYKNQEFSPQNMKQQNLSFDNVFEEIPVVIKNQHLVNALLWDLEEGENGEFWNPGAFDRLDLSTNPFLEKNLEFLCECVDDLAAEQGKFQFYQRQVQRQLVSRRQHEQKRKLEDQQRTLAGEAPLPPEDTSNNPLYKPIPAPSRLESLLITNQINSYCAQINQYSAKSFCKLFLADSVQAVSKVAVAEDGAITSK